MENTCANLVALQVNLYKSGAASKYSAVVSICMQASYMVVHVKLCQALVSGIHEY